MQCLTKGYLWEVLWEGILYMPSAPVIEIQRFTVEKTIFHNSVQWLKSLQDFRRRKTFTFLSLLCWLPFPLIKQTNKQEKKKQKHFFQL